MHSIWNLANNIVTTLVKGSHWTYCDDHFIMYKNIKSLYCIPETNIIVYVNYNSICFFSCRALQLVGF